jgi:hypothetical protein
VTSSEAIHAVSVAGLYPVRIKGEAITDDLDLECLIGSLDDFFTAAKALNATAIFIRSSVLSVDDFTTTSDELDDDSFDDTDLGEEEDPPEEVDLSAIHPPLAKFKKYVDQECALLLIAKGGVTEIAFEIVESWFDQFRDVYAEAEALPQTRSAVLGTRHEKARLKEVKAEAANKRINELLTPFTSDPKFVKGKTIRAMERYVREHLPELEELEEQAGGRAVYDTVQALRDKILTEGLDK